MNNQIRLSIITYLNAYGRQNTRMITALFAKLYHTSKQRIAGNLRALKYSFEAISIVTYIPNSYSEMM